MLAVSSVKQGFFFYKDISFKFSVYFLLHLKELFLLKELSLLQTFCSVTNVNNKTENILYMGKLMQQP